MRPNMIGGWKRAAIGNLAPIFSKDGGDVANTNEAAIDKLHSKIGQLVVEPGFRNAPGIVKQGWQADVR